MLEEKKDVVIVGFSNANTKGVVLHLNKKTSLKTGNVKSEEFWVSWDKIGEALFDNYSDGYSVQERNDLRE